MADRPAGRLKAKDFLSVDICAKVHTALLHKPLS